MSEAVVLLVAAGWLDSSGWLVALLVAVVVLAVSVWSRQWSGMLLVPDRGTTPEEIAARATAWEAARASPAVADALARGDKILAIKHFRDEHGVGLNAAKRAIDQLLSTARTAQLVASGTSAALAEALARGDRVLAVRLYREQHEVGLLEASRAIEHLIKTPVQPPSAGST